MDSSQLTLKTPPPHSPPPTPVPKLGARSLLQLSEMCQHTSEANLSSQGERNHLPRYLSEMLEKKRMPGGGGQGRHLRIDVSGALSPQKCTGSTKAPGSPLHLSAEDNLQGPANSLTVTVASDEWQLS